MSYLQDYYAEKAVRGRMVEFLGGRRLGEADCVYITAEDGSPIPSWRMRPPTDLWACLDAGLDVKRSLWDRRSLIIHIDIEYINFVFPAEPYVEPERSLELQRAVVRRLQEHLLAYGIAPLHLLSGRGHHLIWRVERDSDAFRRLVDLGILVDTLRGIYRRAMPPRGETIGLETGAAFNAAGQLLEFVADQTIRDRRLRCPIPIELAEIETASGLRGREIVCIDLTEYGDPLHTRMVRLPFSIYYKPRQRRAVLGGHVVDRLPPLFLVPLFEMDDRHGLLVMRDPLQAAALARKASVAIPEQSAGTLELAEAYACSRTGACHRWFYSQDHDPPCRWAETYDKTPLDTIPPCARRVLTHPNETLLKPAGLRLVTRVFLALGWHPRHIAGLIRSKYERDFGWGNMFFHYDAATRADFYARFLTTQIVSGLDDLADFRCEDLRAIGYCTDETCDGMLSNFRTSLIERRRHERLASWPLHGLFLPNTDCGLPRIDSQQRIRID